MQGGGGAAGGGGGGGSDLNLGDAKTLSCTSKHYS
jgi:hypothetical protein